VIDQHPLLKENDHEATDYSSTPLKKFRRVEHSRRNVCQASETVKLTGAVNAAAPLRQPLSQGHERSETTREAAMRIAICMTFVLCGLVAPAGAQQGQPAAIPVGVVKTEHRSIEKTLDFVGRVDAVNRVEIRARVQGYLEAVLFKRGGPDQGRGSPLPN
jgi:hypothetical protein